MILSRLYHFPVLLPKVIEVLEVKSGEKYIDATIGGGGHAFEILKAGSVVLGIDQDLDSINYLKEKCKVESVNCKINENLFLENGNFAQLKIIADKYGFTKISGILFDLGMSTNQLKNSGRGFSFDKDEILDMRMDKRSDLKASDIVNSYTEGELYEIFTKYAEEINSRAIVRAILRARSITGPILKTVQLREIFNNVIKKVDQYKNNKAYERMIPKILARLFQALRIAVNNETENLKYGLTQGISLLKPGGRLVVLSYHSLEDRIAKSTFRHSRNIGLVKIINSKPICATKEDIEINPSSRSVKIRIIEKV